MPRHAPFTIYQSPEAKRKPSKKKKKKTKSPRRKSLSPRAKQLLRTMR